MKKATILRIVVAVLILSTILGVLSSGKKEDIGPCTEYNCDVKNFRFSTTIKISKEGDDYAQVKGNIFRFVTDPLTMSNLEGEKIAYADDSYHLIAQDSHMILSDSETIEMVGLVNLLGESYDIYKDGNKIAKAKFNMFNTHGEITDLEDNVIADYTSFYLFNDFDVRVTDECEMDSNIVLMIFASYYSDQHFDSSTSRSSNKKSG